MTRAAAVLGPRADGSDRAVGDALARAAVYRLLGAAFAYPTSDRQPGIAALARAAGGAAPALAGPLAELARCAETGDPAALGEEHVALFDRAARCPPYEGAWGAAQPAGKAALLADVAGFYAAFGLVPAGAQPDVEDHVAAECEFASALCLKEAWALGQGDAERGEIATAALGAFLRDHLGRWAGAFAGALAEATAEPYYRALAAALAAWVAAETARLGLDPAPVGGPAPAPSEEDCFTCPMAPEAPPTA
jgi:TorA maturation chaperone TorD